MIAKDLVQITPTLPPVFNGLGDYADLLGSALGARGRPGRYVVTDTTWSGTRPDAVRLAARTPEALVAALAESEAVVLHYVNYAYDPQRGWPLWLIDGLTQARALRPQMRLAVCFHETWAFGPPWRKAFWFMPRQRQCALHLARLAQQVWTSNGHYARRVDGLRAPDAARCVVMPVCSNVGEPVAPPPYAQRAPRLVCFGRPGNRVRAYRNGAAALARLCAAHGITGIDDVGAPIPAPDLPVIAGVTVTAHGALASSRISELLSAARFGLIDNGTGRLAKSGVFAAYASHGCAPVVETDYPDEDGVATGRTCISLPHGHADPAQVAATALAWYRGHGTAALADMVGGFLGT